MLIKDEIAKVLGDIVGEEEIHITPCEQDSFGDYASNIAMLLFSKLKDPKYKIPKNSKLKKTKYENPKELAEEIVGAISKDNPIYNSISNIEVVEPGFINFSLSEKYLFDEMKRVVSQGDSYGSGSFGKGKSALIEYSSPNIARRFGVGHLRSTIIGQALYNLHAFQGYKTIGENHLGDWGTQFGMIIAQVAEKNLDIDKLNLDKIEDLYVEFNEKVKKDPELKEKAKEWFKKLEEKDKKAQKIWKAAVKISLEESNKIYDLLDVNIDNAHGESFYEDKMKAVIDEVRKRDFSKESQGAEIVEFKNMPPAILLKSDKATTYFTRDLAALKYRMDTWNPNIIIYEVGMEQKLHFKQVFETSKMLGWTKDTKLVHIGHGMFRLGGKKMSTRLGTTVKLEEVLTKSIEKARKIIEKSETGRGLSKDQREKVAEAVGIGAIKYFDLSHRPKSNIDFSWENVFALEGNSAPYLQYTYARTQSVLEKANKRIKDIKIDKELEINKEEELLLRSFVHFSEVVYDAAGNYSPNILCNFLFELAQKYNIFYNQHRILEKEKKDTKISSFRISLTFATGQVIKNGLRLLGIQTPKRM